MVRYESELRRYFFWHCMWQSMFDWNAAFLTFLRWFMIWVLLAGELMPRTLHLTNFCAVGIGFVYIFGTVMDILICFDTIFPNKRDMIPGKGEESRQAERKQGEVVKINKDRLTLKHTRTLCTKRSQWYINRRLTGCKLEVQVYLSSVVPSIYPWRSNIQIYISGVHIHTK